MGKSIVTTDAIGCREVVDDGITGFLCRPRDVGDLVVKLRKILELSNTARFEMGQKARDKMIQEFDEQIVIDHYVKVVKEITKNIV